ncbi:hypothetical protein [Cutibacterium granulosum]|uniref:hypothetical protein n=1 Tax=Cutibacterium granulosum TaxID=33011 RepID=UPI002B2370FA|nr:hypothetical protein [Cutibacterium granulosum]
MTDKKRMNDIPMLTHDEVSRLLYPASAADPWSRGAEATSLRKIVDNSRLLFIDDIGMYRGHAPSGDDIEQHHNDTHLTQSALKRYGVDTDHPIRVITTASKATVYRGDARCVLSMALTDCCGDSNVLHDHAPVVDEILQPALFSCSPTDPQTPVVTAIINGEIHTNAHGRVVWNGEDGETRAVSSPEVIATVLMRTHRDALYEKYERSHRRDSDSPETRKRQEQYEEFDKRFHSLDTYGCADLIRNLT